MAKNKATRRSRPRSSSSSTSKKADGETVVSVKSDSTKKRPRVKAQTTPAKTRAAKIDAVKPKKPPTAFFFYLEDFRKEYQEQNPDVKSMRNIGKACGEKWKTMTYEEKVHYYDIATEKRAEFDADMADFIKRKESAEFDEDDSEFEDDSDFDA